MVTQAKLRQATDNRMSAASSKVEEKDESSKKVGERADISLGNFIT